MKWPGIDILLFWIVVALVIYAQLGYALVMRLWASFWPPRRRPDPVPDHQLPLVSLIIPAHNEEQVLRAKIENSLAIDYPKDRLEIVVASDGSTDQTTAIAREFQAKGVTLLDFQENRGKATVLNEAVHSSRGEVLCLCDANVMFHPNVLQLMVSWLQDPQVGAVTGDVQLQSSDSEFGSGESLYYRLERQLQVDETTTGSTIIVDGGMFVIRRSLFQQIPPDTVLDDYLSSMNVVRAGYQIIYDPAVVALENGTPKSSAEYRRRVRVAAGGAQSIKRGQFPHLTQGAAMFRWASHKLARWLGPLALVVLAVTSLRLWDHGFIFQAAVICQGLVYGLALLGTLVPAFLNFRPVNVAFYFVLSHIAMGVGLIKGTFFGLSGRWKRTERVAIRDSTVSK
jgi:poly-beta-1,6-N-acetyl-D-glucosamine synthase